MAACSQPACVGIAGPSGQCAPHAAGYRLHGGARELRCEHCRRLVRKKSWYRLVGESVTHANPCEPHPDVVKAREAAAHA